MSGTSSPRLGRLSIGVALAATGVVAVAYLAVSVVVVAWLTLSLTAQVDERLDRALRFETAIAADPDAGPPANDGEAGPAIRRSVMTGSRLPPEFPFGRERVTWHIGSDGTATSARTDLELPPEYVDLVGPRTVTIDGNELRIDGAVVETGHVVVGESMATVNDAQTTAIVGLLIVAPFLLGAVFVGSVAIGRRVAMPIERARQRQLAFTADASHELRTPLAVIEANASLALERERDAPWYRAAFERVLGESRRMHRLIDDLLWLARFDATNRATDDGPVDLGLLVEGAADRFSSVAAAKDIALEVQLPSEGATLTAQAEWIDQLIGVLLDNACKYAPEHGHVVVTVESREGRTWLTVDDDGPGIDESQRERIFDRFHRGSDVVGGTGLGLAIGDAIASATDGRWRIDTSPLGGARVAVGWPAQDAADGR